MHKQNKLLLRMEISRQKDMGKLAKLLEDNNIAKVGVHVFYPNNSDRELSVNKRILNSREYVDYAKAVSGFVSSWQRQDNGMFMLEDLNGSKAAAQEILRMNGADFVMPEISYYSPDGCIYRYSEHKHGLDAHHKAFAANNVATGSFERLKEIVRGSAGVFLFGLYKSMCVANAKTGLGKMISELELKAGIYRNGKLAKNPWDFYPKRFAKESA